MVPSASSVCGCDGSSGLAVSVEHLVKADQNLYF